MAYGFTKTLPAITGSHSNFPVLLREFDFPAEAIDGSASSILNDGGNLRAYTDDTKTTRLALHVIRLVTGSTPHIVVRIKIPSAFTEATIYIESDDIETTQPAVTNLYGRNAVYSNNYEIFLGMEEDPSGGPPQVIDYTGNGYDGTSQGSMSSGNSVVGKIGNALDFDGLDNALSIGYTTGLSTWTVQTLCKGNAAPAKIGGNGPVHKGNNFLISWDHGSTQFIGAIAAKFSSSWASVKLGTLLANTWYSLAGTYDGATLSAYNNGSLSELKSQTGSTAFTDQLYIAKHSKIANFWPGVIDYVKISRVARSADWLSTEYDNEWATSSWGTNSGWINNSGADNSITGNAATLVITASQGTIAHGNLINGKSDTVTITNGNGTISYGNAITGSADTIIASFGTGIIAYGNLINGNADTITITEYPGNIPFGNTINGKSDSVATIIGNGTIPYGNAITGKADTITITEYQGNIPFGDTINGKSDLLTTQAGYGSIAYGNFVSGNIDTITTQNGTGNIPQGNAMTGVGDIILSQNSNGQIAYGNLINGNSDSVATNIGNGTIPYGSAITGKADTIIASLGTGIIAYGNFINGNADTITITEYQGNIPFGNTINGKSDSLITQAGTGSIAYGIYIEGNSDTITITNGAGEIPETKAITGKSDTLSTQIGTGIVSYGNRINGKNYFLTLQNTTGTFPKRSIPKIQKISGIPKLKSLRRHILSIPNELRIDPDDLITFTENGAIESHAEGTNQHFQLKYKAKIILQDFSDNPLKLFFWLLQWMKVNQPNHKPDAVQFDSDMIDDKKTDLEITIDITEDIKVESSAQGIKLYSADEPDINPELLTAENWTLYANNERVADWVNNG